MITVANETHKKLEGALALTYLVEKLDRFSVTLGSEIVNMLHQYHQLSIEYQRLYECLEDEDIQPNTLMAPIQRHTPLNKLKPLYKDTEESFHDVQYRLRHVTKCLLRGISQLPVTDSILNESRSYHTSRTEHLLTSLSELCDIMKEKLLTTSLDEVRRRDHVEEVREEQKEADKMIIQLQQELMESKKQLSKEVCY